MKKYRGSELRVPRARHHAPPIRRRSPGRKDERGVLVEAVREGGWAALGHLADGDLRAGDRRRAGRRRRGRSEDDGARRRDEAGAVVLKVRRGIRTLFVELQSGWPARSDDVREAACRRRRALVADRRRDWRAVTSTAARGAAQDDRAAAREIVKKLAGRRSSTFASSSRCACRSAAARCSRWTSRSRPSAP